MLRVDLEDWDGNTAYAVYGKFEVDDEKNKYKLTVADYDRSSNAEDALVLQNNMFFTTKDRYNLPFDNYFNPAQEYTGAWWYTTSSVANLNGKYLGNAMAMNGMIWVRWTGQPLSLKRSEMKIRPLSFI